jgi:hypothetical protein
VKKKNESASAETSGGAKSISQQIVLPGGGDLWVPRPGGSPLPKSALESLESKFRRAMSSFFSK